MISKKVEDALLEELKSTNTSLEQCRGYLQKARGEQKKKLERTEIWLEVERLRISICMDILNGRAFTVHEESVQGEAPVITVVKPSPSQAKLVDLTEKLGGRVTSYKFGESKEEN